MPNHSAFISELYYRSNTSITEFIEVTLKASEDPADYTLSFHTQSGALYSGSNAPGQVGGLLLLSDPNNGVSQNATDPDYNVYTIITVSRRGHVTVSRERSPCRIQKRVK